MHVDSGSLATADALALEGMNDTIINAPVKQRSGRSMKRNDVPPAKMLAFQHSAEGHRIEGLLLEAARDLVEAGVEEEKTTTYAGKQSTSWLQMKGLWKSPGVCGCGQAPTL